MTSNAPIDDPNLHSADASLNTAAGGAPIPLGPPVQTPANGVSPGSADAPSPASPGSVEPDARLVQETRNQIRVIVQEITQLAQSDVDEDAFYAEFLQRVVSALASEGAAIWTLGDDGLDLRYQINFPRARLHDDKQSAQRHYLLLQQLLADGQAALIPPQSGSNDTEEAGNPTEHLLIVGFVRFEDRPMEIVEIFQRPAGGPTTQRGYLRFVLQMCELAQTFVTRKHLKNFHQRELLWDNLEQFIRSIHSRLDVKETCYAMANESRRLLQCDRVSIAVRKGRHYQLEAVSGLDTLDRRAEEVNRLGKLAGRVAHSRQTLWRRDTDESPLAPQVEEALDSYLDISHAKLVVVQPLYDDDLDDDDEGPALGEHREPIGALIVEQLRDSRTEQGVEQRVEMIAAHGGSALANALAHDQVFLMPLWRAIGKSKILVQARNLPKTIAVLVVLIMAAAALAIVPAPLKITCNGQLIPSERFEVFAQTEGVVAELPVRHAQVVEPNQLLVRLRSAPLQEKMTRLEGEVEEKKQQSAARNSVLIRNARLDPIEQQRIEGEVRRLDTAIINLKERIKLVEIEQQGLRVLSTQRAQIATWRLHERLWNRPVHRGDGLMTLYDPDGDWELEVWMPERRMGHIDDQLHAEKGEPLTVSFVLTAHPDQRFEGELIEIQRSADVHESEGNVVRLRVSIDKTELPELRNEATLTAQVHCGMRPVGAVWFGDLIETIQKTSLLWWP